MKLKGDLESIGVAELFKTLADQRATGILVVTSPMGEKTIALTSGEIAVATDNLSERTRLGDLLVARGRMTEVQLTEALKAQKLNPRAKLGDLMVKLGMITPEIIAEAVKFQVEEQVLDLYTWKEANFEFDSDKSIDDIYDPNNNGGPLQRLNINVGPLIADAAKREENWKQIQARIPTPYLCFKTTPKGEELVSKSPRNTQVIIKLLKEGRTLETTVKRSCIGRINVCNAIIKLLDDGWIMPTPAAELRFLASEHRFKKRYLDALYIYRRLLDSASSPVDKAELERSIQDIIEDIHEAAASGESAEGSEIVSFKDAAHRFRRRQKARRAALAIFGVTAVIVAAILVFQQIATNPKLPDEYIKILGVSNAKLEAGDYDGAIKLWDDFYKSIPDKGSQLANFARDHQAMAISKQKTYLKKIFKDCIDLEKAHKLPEAKSAFKEFAEKYPDFEDTPTATEAVARIEKLQEDQKKAAATEAQRKQAEEAISFFTKKDYSSARVKLKKAEVELPQDSVFLKDVQDALKKIQEVEDRINAMKATADGEVRKNEAEKAIDDYNKAGSEWPDLPASEEARKLAANLKIRLDKLTREMQRAKLTKREAGDQAALDIYLQAKREYPEFEKAREIDNEIKALATSVAGLDDELKKAKDLWNIDKSKSREIFKKLLKENYAFCVSKDITVPVPIVSFPANAKVKLDGVEVKELTPIEALWLPVGKPFVLHFEKKGYEAAEKAMKGVSVFDFDRISQPLKRTHLFPPLLLESPDLKAAGHKGGIFAPPCVIDGVLYILHGNSLSALDPATPIAVRNKVDSVFTWDESVMKTHIDVDWWFPRSAPLKIKADKLLVTSRTRELIEVDTKTMRTRKLVTLPADPIGQPCIDPSSMRLGHPLVVVACADGKVYVFDLDEASEKPPVEKPIWPGVSVDAPALLACGPGPRPNHVFLALSTSGVLSWYETINGNLSGTPLKLPHGALAEGNSLPSMEAESLAAFVHNDGFVTAVDLKEHSVLWTREALKENDKGKFATASGSDFFVITVDGRLFRFRKEGMGGKPDQVKMRDIGEPPELPLLIGNKTVFVVTENAQTHEHEIHAIDANDLNTQLWYYRTEHKPSAMSIHDNLLYIGTEDGYLIVLNLD